MAISKGDFAAWSGNRDLLPLYPLSIEGDTQARNKNLLPGIKAKSQANVQCPMALTMSPRRRKWANQAANCLSIRRFAFATFYDFFFQPNAWPEFADAVVKID